MPTRACGSCSTRSRARPSSTMDVRVTPAPTHAGRARDRVGRPVGRGRGRRAARFGLDFLAQTDGDELGDAYRDECARLGRTPGNITLPSPELADDDLRRRRSRPRVGRARPVPAARRDDVRGVEPARQHRQPVVRHDGRGAACRERCAPGDDRRRRDRARAPVRVARAAPVVRRAAARARVAVPAARRRGRAAERLSGLSTAHGRSDQAVEPGLVQAGVARRRRR